jgi:probable HAF family extracellular repeat protein
MCITTRSGRLTSAQRAANCVHLLLAGTLAAGLSFATAKPVLAQASYVVQDLGVLPGDTSSVAWAINANGDVVGWSDGPNGTRGFVYTNLGGLVALPGLPARPRAVARDINDAGDIVGSANAGGTDLGHAVLWSGGLVQDLGTLGTGFYSEAWGINNVGQIVGTSYTNGGSGLLGVHGFVYTREAGLRDLTPDSDQGAATDINDAGQVTGYKTAFGGYHAFRWQGGGFLDLGVLPFFAHSFGWAINASGQVAGNATSASGNSERLVRFTDGSGLQDLGGAGEHNTAWGLNQFGHVVGCSGESLQRALRYTDEAGLQDLNRLIDPSLGWVLFCATDINDAGQIVGYAYNQYTSRTHAVRLQPGTTAPPECTFNCLRSTSIVLRSRGHRIDGSVTVQDENGASVAQAVVFARWTYPDGSSDTQYVSTRTDGQARFLTTAGQSGRYTLTVVNIQLSQHTFNPSESVLTKSIVVR